MDSFASKRVKRIRKFISMHPVVEGYENQIPFLRTIPSEYRRLNLFGFDEQ